MTLRILITDLDLGDPSWEVDLLKAGLDCDVSVAQCRSEADVLAAVHSVQPDAILVQWAPITDAVLSAASNCRIISRIGIGLDMIDLDAAEAHGIPVMNVPHYCTEEVATHALALGLALTRRLPQFDAAVRSGTWDAAGIAPSIKLVSQSTVGLVGCGAIGRVVADGFAALGASVIISDPRQGDDPYPRVSLDDLAARSDIISLHAPLVPATHHVVDDEFLGKARQSPVIVNVSRGGLIDLPALERALHEGRVAGAGLDVFEVEPLPSDSSLRDAPNVLLSPHAAWCSAAALPELRRGVVENIVNALSAGVSA